MIHRRLWSERRKFGGDGSGDRGSVEADGCRLLFRIGIFRVGIGPKLPYVRPVPSDHWRERGFAPPAPNLLAQPADRTPGPCPLGQAQIEQLIRLFLWQRRNFPMMRKSQNLSSTRGFCKGPANPSISLTRLKGRTDPIFGLDYRY